MKEELFKVNYENYRSIVHNDSVPLTTIHPNISDIFDEDPNVSFSFSDEIISIKRQRVDKVKFKKLVYHPKETLDTEGAYIENYGNPLAKVSKTYGMVVVEKEGYKVSLKLFWGYRTRPVGKCWFKTGRNMRYITVNTKTGDVYTGKLLNYQKKTKATRDIKKNFFADGPISRMKRYIRNVFIKFTTNHHEFTMKALSKFLSEIDNNKEFDTLDFEKRLFRFYLDKKGIKYPNNFYLYAKKLVGPEIRKMLKKSDNKLVEAFMKTNQIGGKQLKIALHNSTGLNTLAYLTARKLFGDDWINQDPNFILNSLNSPVDMVINIPNEFLNLISKDELKRVFGLFKKVYFDGSLESYTVHDHIIMYTELKLYGEADLRWNSNVEDDDSFRREHLDWSDKLQFYRRGYYERIYPDYTYDLIEAPINDFYPVVLNNSHNYNEESSIQSNCVKTYIGRASSIIISLRKGSPTSNERATIEYNVINEDGKLKCERVQTLGRFNHKLEEQWNGPLFILDKILLSYIADKRFETVKITKKCSNGEFLKSDSEWDKNNRLVWSYRVIESNQTIIELEW